jgi:hypothetical protein
MIMVLIKTEYITMKIVYVYSNGYYLRETLIIIYNYSVSILRVKKINKYPEAIENK